MLTVTAFSSQDWQQARDLFAWMRELEGGICPAQRHYCLLIASKGMERASSESVLLAAQRAFQRVIMIEPWHADETGWPVSCNNLFRTAVNWARQLAKAPFWWHEPDCIPLRKGWLEVIEREYKRVGKPFLGTICEAPFRHLSGCAVYPPDVREFNPECVDPEARAAWDCVAQEKTIKHAAGSAIFQHVWGNQTNNIAPTFPNQRSLRLINRKAVVFHRNKDGTLIRRLLERRNDRARCFMRSVCEPDVGNGFQAFTERDQSQPKPVCHGVTLAAIDGSADARKTLGSLVRAGNQMAFDRVLLFARSQPELMPDWITFRAIPPLDLSGYNRFCMAELYKYVETSHCLTVQADSGINNVAAWDEGWKNWDYLGAPWPAGWAWGWNREDYQVVGNSGGCMRSKQFLEATAELPTDHVAWHGEVLKRCVDDVSCCVNNRRALEDLGMKFAPVEVAARFAFEQPTPCAPKLNGQFMFHLKH